MIYTTIVDHAQKPYPGLVLMGGMSGVGAKGSMAYGLIAANLLLHNRVDESEGYYDAVKALSLTKDQV